MNIDAKRGENEVFESYKTRMKIVSKVLRDYLKGRIFWNSAKGTYRREEHE